MCTFILAVTSYFLLWTVFHCLSVSSPPFLSLSMRKSVLGQELHEMINTRLNWDKTKVSVQSSDFLAFTALLLYLLYDAMRWSSDHISMLRAVSMIPRNSYTQRKTATMDTFFLVLRETGRQRISFWLIASLAEGDWSLILTINS